MVLLYKDDLSSCLYFKILFQKELYSNLSEDKYLFMHGLCKFSLLPKPLFFPSLYHFLKTPACMESLGEKQHHYQVGLCVSIMVPSTLPTTAIKNYELVMSILVLMCLCAGTNSSTEEFMCLLSIGGFRDYMLLHITVLS